MERPLCPLCKTKHFAREPHEFQKDASRGVSGDGEAVDVRRPFGAGVVQRTTKKAGGKKATTYLTPDGRFDRTAYQREYMRRRRERKPV